MNKKHIKLVATDLDGTFLKDDRSVSERNLKALHRLGEKNIVRVVATGRNLRKVEEVLSPDVPFDYIVFSSGAGVFNWKEKKHIFNRNITPNSTERLVTHFKQQDYNFYGISNNRITISTRLLLLPEITGCGGTAAKLSAKNLTGFLLFTIHFLSRWQKTETWKMVYVSLC